METALPVPHASPDSGHGLCAFLASKNLFACQMISLRGPKGKSGEACGPCEAPRLPLGSAASLCPRERHWRDTCPR